MTAKFSQLFNEQQYHMLLFYLFLLYNYSKLSKEHIYLADLVLGRWFLLQWLLKEGKICMGWRCWRLGGKESFC